MSLYTSPNVAFLFSRERCKSEYHPWFPIVCKQNAVSLDNPVWEFDKIVNLAQCYILDVAQVIAVACLVHVFFSVCSSRSPTSSRCASKWRRWRRWSKVCPSLWNRGWSTSRSMHRRGMYVRTYVCVCMCTLGLLYVVHRISHFPTCTYIVICTHKFMHYVYVCTYVLHIHCMHFMYSTLA